ncbi:hypothetical protein ALC53_01884 [Atta colombica]|uniref:Uncharacterized protein n=1 Tax=Atta colombica TaxID=520822 RepID=A0A151I5S7_9HYME|nr:hypothetical protein ALC53_01884 [Atta colombica]
MGIGAHNSILQEDYEPDKLAFMAFRKIDTSDTPITDNVTKCEF